MSITSEKSIPTYGEVMDIFLPNTKQMVVFSKFFGEEKDSQNNFVELYPTLVGPSTVNGESYITYPSSSPEPSEASHHVMQLKVPKTFGPNVATSYFNHFELSMNAPADFPTRIEGEIVSPTIASFSFTGIYSKELYGIRVPVQYAGQSTYIIVYIDHTSNSETLLNKYSLLINIFNMGNIPLRFGRINVICRAYR